MSAANFDMNNAGFPLYAKDDEYIKVCPECGVTNSGDADSCEYCGADLDTAQAIYDDIQGEFIFEELGKEFEQLNDDLVFYRVELKSGYFCGTQFKVSLVEDDPANLDNDDCNYFFDMCRSLAIRKFKSEQNKLKKALAKIADSYGYNIYVRLVTFSSGETWYQRQEAAGAL